MADKRIRDGADHSRAAWPPPFRDGIFKEEYIGSTIGVTLVAHTVVAIRHQRLSSRYITVSRLPSDSDLGPQRRQPADLLIERREECVGLRGSGCVLVLDVVR